MAQAMLGIFAVLAAGLAMLAGLSAFQARRPQHPEFMRKLVHIGTGLLALTLPWVFVDAWPVVLLTGTGTVILCGIHQSGTLGRCLGSAIDCVGRASYGDVCFLLVVPLLYVAAQDDVFHYVVPIAILTFADSSAALIGVWLGRHRYPALGGVKSIEGSAAFFLVALLSNATLLPCFVDLGLAAMLLTAMLLALVTTVLEGLTGRGFDNLTVPVGAYIVLRAMA